MEKVNKNKVVGEKVRLFALGLVGAQNYDLENEFTPQEIADAVANLSMALVGRGVNRELVVVQTPVSLFSLGLTWKAQSGKRSWLSCTDDQKTYVTNSEIPIISDPFNITEQEVHELLIMMDRAWFSFMHNNA